jgi:PAS domain S-box-containing protein
VTTTPYANLEAAFEGESVGAVSSELKRLLAPWEMRREMAICYDARRSILAHNTAFARKFGRSSRELLDHPIVELIHPEDQADWLVGTEALEASWKPVQREQRWHTAQGWRWLSWEESYVFDDLGNPLLIVAVGRDVTRRRLSEEHFSKLAQAVEQSPVAILLTALDGAVQYVNSHYTEMTGFTLEDIFERDINVLREGHPDEASFLELQEKVSEGHTWIGELTTRRKDGRVRWERVQVSPVRGAHGEIAHLLSLREDITERKELENQLRQAQKMESLGTLSSGIAHDFNNILAIIRGYSELLVLRENIGEAGRSKVSKILEATNRACELIRQILTFSRKAEVCFRPVRLNLQIEEFAKLLRETFPRTIQLELELDHTLPRIPADPGQIQQVIMNLCVNARDAMNNGGLLTIRTSRVPGSNLAHLKLPTSCDYARIEVIDSGPGIPENLIARIFEPFFTTKEKSGGTGLGLSVVYGIISNHFGTIDVQNKPPRGAQFSIYLPIAEIEEENSDDVAQDAFPVGSERIAIIDDEPSIRDLLGVAFQTHGYDVETYPEGGSVIEQVEANDFKFDAVVLDLDMPHFNGLEVLHRLRAAQPGIPVVVITGNLEQKVRVQLDRTHRLSYLQKPFHLGQVGVHARKLLDQKAKKK